MGCEQRGGHGVNRTNHEDGIRALIRRLDVLYQEGCALTDPACVRLSQELDQLIVAWYRPTTQPTKDGGDR